MLVFGLCVQFCFSRDRQTGRQQECSERFHDAAFGRGGGVSKGFFPCLLPVARFFLAFRRIDIFIYFV